jgi:DNA-binding CsgD family transcriptional regulator
MIGRPMEPFRVGVLDEHEIFRRGIAACIADDPSLTVELKSARGPVDRELDAAVASPAVAAEHGFPCPLVVCTSERGHDQAFRQRNPAALVLSRVDLTAELLVATVRAAAAGLQVGPAGPDAVDPLGERDRRLLQLLADGADTRYIASSMSYSERTIKGMIRRVEQELGASSRAQAVAKGIRQGLI